MPAPDAPPVAVMAPPWMRMVPVWALSSPPMPAAPAPPVAESEPMPCAATGTPLVIDIVAPPGTVTPARPTPPVTAFSPMSASVAAMPGLRWIAPASVTDEASTTALESVTEQLASMPTVALVSKPESSNGPAPDSIRAPRTAS